MRPIPWSREEVEATVAAYLAMLVEFHSGSKVNKAERNRSLQRLLYSRSIKAIEFKHQNISAVLAEEDLDYLDGYFPAYNYQDLLRTVVLEQLASDPIVRDMVSRVAAHEVPAASRRTLELPVQVAAPRTLSRVTSERYERPFYARRNDYELVEAANRSLGLAGELLILEFEVRRLRRAGKRRLANRIEHTARSRGDGLGYDIASFETDGRDRLIEVKTTRRAQLMPFHVSRNEVEASKSLGGSYHLYRLYRYGIRSEFYVLDGPLDQACILDPLSFRARVA